MLTWRVLLQRIARSHTSPSLLNHPDHHPRAPAGALGAAATVKGGCCCRGGATGAQGHGAEDGGHRHDG